MRFVIIVFIWIFFVGGLWAYTANRDATLPEGPAQVADREVLTRDFVLEITPGFSIEQDPFALNLDDGSQAPDLEVRLNGRALSVDAKDITRGKVLRITNGITPTLGFNEIYVQASPPVSETHLDHGLRVRLLDGGTTVTDQTIWGSRGAVVAGTVTFTLAAAKEDDHDH